MLWITIGAGTTVLLVAGMRKKDAGLCTDVKVSIKGVKDNFFVDENDVKQIIRMVLNGEPIGRQIGSFNLAMMEAALEKSTWIKGAEMFFDNNNILSVNILEREPVARIFTTTGATFYIDTAIMMLPLSEKFPARLPVFTNFPSDKTALTAGDSNLLRSISVLSTAIQQDAFRMGLIDQVDITPARNFEMIPKIGDQLIIFGDATEVEEKFDKLEKFYRLVMANSNWNKYSSINVQYKNQVVAKLRGAEEKTADSLRTLQIIQMMVNRAEQHSGDSIANILPDNDRSASTDSSMIQQSIQRDDETEGAFIPMEKPVAEKPKPGIAVIKPVINKPGNAAKPKPVTKPPVKPKPKAIMPRNDY